MWYWIIPPLLLAVFALLLWYWSRGPRAPSRRSLERELERVLSCQGAARCQAASGLLERLARSDDAQIQRVWDRLEMPLLECLPDCPPGSKGDLVRILEACHAACRHRDYQRRIIDLRNAITV